MKKVTLLLIGFFCSLTMFAGEITQAQAMEKACQVLKGKQLTMQAMHHRAASNDNAYYVFNAEHDGGFLACVINTLVCAQDLDPVFVRESHRAFRFQERMLRKGCAEGFRDGIR